MKKLLIAFFAIFTLGTSSVAAAEVYDIDPYLAVDWDSNGDYYAHEYLVEYQQTAHDFNDMMQSQIVVWGYPTSYNPYPAVNIKTSLGHYVGKQAVTQNGIVVGYVMGFDHYGVTNGYLESKYNNVYDSTAFIR